MLLRILLQKDLDREALSFVLHKTFNDILPFFSRRETVSTCHWLLQCITHKAKYAVTPRTTTNWKSSCGSPSNATE